MAGSILINWGGGVALNGFGYDRIVEAVRKHLDTKSEIATKSIFEPNDLEGMSFISLIEADPQTFQSFQRAAVAAYEEATLNRETFAEWDELMQRLRDDPRSGST